MRNKIINIFACIGLISCWVVGCGVGTDSGTPPTNYQTAEAKIANWQDREFEDRKLAGGFVQILLDERDSLLWDVQRVLGRAPYIQYESDGEGKDYWQTSLETHLRRKGDCEDQAIYSLFALRQSNITELYPEVEIYLRWVEYQVSGERKGHTVCVVDGGISGRIEISNMAAWEKKEWGKKVAEFDEGGIW